MNRRYLIIPLVLLGAVGAIGAFMAYSQLQKGDGPPSYPNAPLATYEPDGGYREGSLAAGDGNTDSTLVVVTFSGGGTRATSLAYGVFQGLGEVALPPGPDGRDRTLLEEVDIVSAISGGAFTALGYGLWGKELFNGHFEKAFLRQDIQGRLLDDLQDTDILINPRHPSEIAADYYNQHIYQGATYGDLLKQNRRPFIGVTATDMARQEHFQFSQRDFDLLGSDLSRLPLAWAAAATSAFPPLLSPVRMKYFHSPVQREAITTKLAEDPALTGPNTRLWAEDLLNTAAYRERGAIEIDTESHQYFYLVDGGGVDNLGLSVFADSMNYGHIRKQMEAGTVRQLVLIIVDAGKRPVNNLEASADLPDPWTTCVTTAASSVRTATWVAKYTLNILFKTLHPVLRQLNGALPPNQTIAPLSSADIYLAEISFASLTDEAERSRFDRIPTAFSLEDADVDALIEVGRRLVKENPDIQRLVEDLKRQGEGAGRR